MNANAVSYTACIDCWKESVAVITAQAPQARFIKCQVTVLFYMGTAN